MKNVQEGSKGIACNFSNFSLVHECLVEQVSSILLLAVFSPRRIFSVFLLLFLGGHTGYVETHLY